MVNKKNMTAFGAALLLLLTLAGCGGVPMAEYEKLQAGPFVLYVGDLAPQLEEGKTYVFEIVLQEGLEITREEYKRGVFSVEEAVVQYRLRVSGFRAAQEGDYGLECSHFVFETQEK